MKIKKLRVIYDINIELESKKLNFKNKHKF